MVGKYDLKEYLKKNAGKIPHTYKEEDDAIYDKDGNYICSLDKYLETYRKHSGESFESIYYEHAFLQNVLRCTECGTVIFSTEDEGYDPRLKCPTCTNYQTHFEYWTKEDIESDEEKQNTIKWLKEMTERRAEQDRRIKRRNGKQDWQIAIKKFRGKKRYLKITLECDDITKSYFKGLRLRIDIDKKKNKNDTSYVVVKHFTIPLSWSYFYIRYVYQHLGKCHPDFRSKWYIGKARD